MPTEIERKACSLPVVFGAYVLVLLVACGVGYALMWATIATADISRFALVIENSKGHRRGFPVKM